MDLLARREHSEQELQQKLQARGYGPEAVGEVLVGLKTAGMQDDVRYTEAYIRSRVAKGYGPVRISRELYERGIPRHLQHRCWPEWIWIGMNASRQSGRRSSAGRRLPISGSRQDNPVFCCIAVLPPNRPRGYSKE